MPTDLPAGVCRFCSCTETTPCAGGCAWTDDTQTLCTMCLTAAAIAQDVIKVLKVVAGGSSLRLVTDKWDRLELEQQRILVANLRGYLAGVYETLEQEQGTDAIAAYAELAVITDYLEGQFAEQLRDDEGIGACVVRLLALHAQKKVVLA